MKNTAIKKKVFIIFSLISVLQFSVYAQWKPAGDKIKSVWAEKVDPTNVLPEYPRPIMERPQWQNLNGLWDYAVTPLTYTPPDDFVGKILVPFAVESSLSGVQKRVGHEQILWYHRTFDIPKTWINKKVLLHFGAVDWRTEVWINDIRIGSHEGGFTPFSFDITSFLNSKGSQQIIVKVWDPTEKGPQPIGKQWTIPTYSDCFYTPVTGIWQTVWIEPVSNVYISNIRTTPDIDNDAITVETDVCGGNYGVVAEVRIREGDKLVKTARTVASESVKVQLKSIRLWSPENPFVYEMEVVLFKEGKEQDRVKSYFAMRKISTVKDEHGIVRLQLNNENYYQLGTLDQGWWPGGLYTPPTDDALRYDIEVTKDLGFNMIRKHVKVEPARWYTHCDRMGILVWQDMPLGDMQSSQRQGYQHFTGVELQRSPPSEAIFRKELKDMLDYLYSYPSVVIWVLFNEGAGQFKTVEIAEWTKKYDPSRLVDPASSANFFPVGDILDLHHYPDPDLYFYDDSRATVQGEYGGIGLEVKGHKWNPEYSNKVFTKFKTSEELTAEYVRLAELLKKQINIYNHRGFSASVYTQITDVEQELNGLMTYDRKVLKVDKELVRKVNQEIISMLKEK